MIDPIKPKHRLTKKPNFKKEKLDGGPVFVSPGVYTRETDFSNISLGLTWDRDIWIPSPGTPNGNGRIYNIQVGNIGRDDADRYLREVMNSFRNSQYGQLDHPVGISSRGLVREDGTFDLQSYDIVTSPSTRSAILGGERMMYDASMFLPIHKKKKTLWGRIKDFFKNIYNIWERAEE